MLIFCFLFIITTNLFIITTNYSILNLHKGTKNYQTHATSFVVTLLGENHIVAVVAPPICHRVKLGSELVVIT